MKKKKQKSFFRYVIFINSIKNVTAKAYDELIDEISVGHPALTSTSLATMLM